MNGGVFLGLNGIVIKSHGGTDAGRLRLGHRARLQHGPQRTRRRRSTRTSTEYRTANAAAPRADRRDGCGVTGIRSVVLGCGGYLPRKVLTNDDLAKIVDTSDEWIAQRTGIRERHIAADGEMTSDLGGRGRAARARRRRPRRPPTST